MIQIQKSENSVEGWALRYLEERGLFPQQAEEVIATMKANPVNAFMNEVWGKGHAGYAEPVMVSLSISLDQAALTWIDANKPQHRARPMFAQEGK